MKSKNGNEIINEIIETLHSELSPEKKLRNAFTKTGVITHEDAITDDRERLHLWREKFLESDLPNLGENDVATGELRDFHQQLLREIESICQDIIKHNSDSK
jgi:hypothetical protein